MVLAAAILAIGIGIFIAMDANSRNHRQGNPPPSATPSATPSAEPVREPERHQLADQPADRHQHRARLHADERPDLHQPHVGADANPDIRPADGAGADADADADADGRRDPGADPDGRRDPHWAAETAPHCSAQSVSLPNR